MFFSTCLFGGDFGYTFSPGEIVRTLGTSAIPESPLTQNLRMFPYSSYGNLMGAQPVPGNSGWTQASQQFSQTQQRPSNLSTMTIDANKLAKEKKRSKKDDDEGEDKPKKKTKKAPKPEDPNEPRITSRHRGVCWYKRTKKVGCTNQSKWQEGSRWVL